MGHAGRMKDKSLYQQILGDTTPWRVAEVQIKAEEQIIEVHLTLARDALWACPECNRRMHVKGKRARTWRHLDSCQFRTLLTADVPTVECPEHGAQVVQVPWAEKSSRFTLLFERLAVEVLQACSASKAAELLDITWEQADGIKQRAVRRGMARRTLDDLEYVCVDEKAVGHGHDYVTVVTGYFLGESRVLYVGDGKGEDSLNGFWDALGPEGCANIQVISMDMGKPYQASAKKHCPEAEIIFDPFHIMKMFNKAVDEVRRQEAAWGTKEEKKALLKTRQLWLWGEENLPARHAERFEELKKSSLKTARAWRLKELWRTFKHCVDEHDGLAFFKQWYRLAMASKLEPIKRIARMLKEKWDHVVTYLKYRFCNAIAESVNSRIQLLIQKSCGYRNRERFKTDVLFHLGGLNLYPSFNQ